MLISELTMTGTQNQLGSGRGHESRAMAMKVKTMEARLKAWRAQIEELTARAEQGSPLTSFEYRQRIDDLKAKCAVIESDIDKLKS